MGGNYFYKGTDYKFDPAYGGTSQTYSDGAFRGIGLAADARTANQLSEVSKKLNTGATTIEVGAVSPDIFESIPKDHFAELNRLRKLVGNNVELTLHAPIVEPTGLSRQGWDESERKQAERQMTDAIMKAHDLNPDGNVVTTFHSSAVSLPAEKAVWEKIGDKNVRVVKEVVVIDEKSGGIQTVQLKPSPFESNKPVDANEQIKKLNNTNWYKNLQGINFHAEQGAHHIDQVLKLPEEFKGKVNEKDVLKLYQDYADGKGEKVEEGLAELDPLAKTAFRERMREITHGDLYLREAYNSFRELFDQAYRSLENSDNPKAKEDIAKLDAYRKKIAPKLDYLQSKEAVKELAETLRDGVHVMRSIEVPQMLKPFREFALDKSAETFGNVAFNAYKEFGSNAPIVSIENPPAGQGILHTGKDLKELVERSRKQFESRVMKEGLSESKAKEESKKLIGVTWDVGHINMLRKFGAGVDELKEEAKQIAPHVKHVHLSDNFGLEHTELPMGMGNVPKEMLQEIEKETKKFKKIIEAGNWYQHFQSPPIGETLGHFGSPIYSQKNASYFEPRAYSTGLGNNPDIHHALYGAGFANLPVELGGQMSGRSRVSGNPLD